MRDETGDRDGAEERAARLMAVRATGLANERGSPVLDALARVALRLLGVPAAFVTLVDETRQFMPGLAAGEARPPLGRSIPLEQSICRHALARREALVVDDAAAHPLTRATPAVTELGIGAYLGVPLRDARGNGLGTLCAVDFAPRTWGEPDLRALEELAAAASAELSRAEVLARERTALDELRVSEARFRTVLDAIREGVVLQDRSDAIQLANPAARRILALGDLEGRSSYDPWDAIGVDGTPFDPNEHPSVVAFRTGAPQHDVQMGVRRGTGDRVWLSIDALPVLLQGETAPASVVAIFRDITRAKQLEAEQRQSHKLEAMGRLASGVAHDVNNLLTVIHANAELLREDIGSSKAAATALEDVDEIVRTVDRASALTKQLLAFGRKQVVLPRVLTLHDVIESAATMLRRVLGDDVRLVTDHDPANPVVCADRGQLDQVLVNLAVNARDAMPRGGKLTMRTRCGTPGAAPDGAPPARVFGAPYVVVSVSDTGTGMGPETLANAFEPFFTTKEEGRGTGLGLSTVYGIATQAGGAAWIASQEGKGTTVSVAFPLSRAEAEGEAARPNEGAGARARTRLRVLVVDDDVDVRGTVSRLLERRGYAVVPADTAEAALSAWILASKRGERIDVVVTDLSLPALSGRDLVAKLREARQELAVVVISGQGDPSLSWGEAALVQGRTRFLEKPFAPDDLVTAIEDLAR